MSKATEPLAQPNHLGPQRGVVLFELVDATILSVAPAQGGLVVLGLGVAHVQAEPLDRTVQHRLRGRVLVQDLPIEAARERDGRDIRTSIPFGKPSTLALKCREVLTQAHRVLRARLRARHRVDHGLR